MTLQKLLAGDQRKCSATALHALQRRGWVHGPEDGYQLTETGWRVAEFSEEAPPNRRLEFQLA